MTSKNSVTITLEMLRAKGACAPTLKDLENMFGTSQTFATPEALAIAVQATYEIGWAARHLLSFSARTKFIDIDNIAFEKYITPYMLHDLFDIQRREYSKEVCLAFAELYFAENISQ